MEILKGVFWTKISEAWLLVNSFLMPGSWESSDQMQMRSDEAHGSTKSGRKIGGSEHGESQQQQ